MAGPGPEEMKHFLKEMRKLEKSMRADEPQASTRARTAGSRSTNRQSNANSSANGKVPGGSSGTSSSAQRPQKMAPPGAAGHTYDYFKEKWGNFDLDAAVREAEASEKAAPQASESRGFAGGSHAMPGGKTGLAQGQPSGRKQPAPLGGPAGVMQRLAEVSDMDEDKPPDATSEKERGNEFFKGGNYEEALACYSRSIAMQPTAVAYANRAMAALKLKRYTEAEEDCTEALALDDQYVKAYSRRGTARRHLARYAEALEDFSAALSLEPDSRELQKQQAEAEALLEKQGGRARGKAERKQATPLVARESRKVQSTPPGTAAAPVVPTSPASTSRAPSTATPGREPDARPARGTTAGVAPARRGIPGATTGTAGASSLADSLPQRATTDTQAPSLGRPGSSSSAATDTASPETVQERCSAASGEGGTQQPRPPKIGPRSVTESPHDAAVAANGAGGGKHPRASSPPVVVGVGASQNGSATANGHLPAGTNRRNGGSDGASTMSQVAAAAAVARAAMAAKEAILKDMEGPKSAYEFETLWRAVGGDRTAQAEILQRMAPGSLPSLFKEALSAPLLVEILLTIDSEFLPARAELAADLLEGMTKVARFAMTTMFLTGRDKAALRRLWEKAASNTAIPRDIRRRVEGVKAKYRV